MCKLEFGGQMRERVEGTLGKFCSWCQVGVAVDARFCQRCGLALRPTEKKEQLMEEKEFARLWKRVRGVVRSLVRDMIAEDVVSGVLVKVLEKDLHEPLSFILLKHMAIDEIRRLRRQQRERWAEKLDPPEGERVVEQREAAGEVSELMREVKLSVLEGRTLYHWFYGGQGEAEVAALVGAEKEVVRAAKEKALEKLRVVACDLGREEDED